MQGWISQLILLVTDTSWLPEVRNINRENVAFLISLGGVCEKAGTCKHGVPLGSIILPEIEYLTSPSEKKWFYILTTFDE